MALAHEMKAAMNRKSLVGVLPFFVAAAIISSIMAETPVSHWDFDGNLNDSEGRVKDGLSAMQGTVRYVTSKELPGVEGKAVALGVEKGDARYLRADPSTDVQLGAAYTIEAWIHPTQLAAWNRLALHWGKEYSYHFAIHKGLLSLYHGQADGTLAFAEGGVIQPGCWQHVAGVARRNDKEPSNSRLEVYLNGKLTGSAPYDGTIQTLKNEGFGVGDAANGSGKAIRFRGYIDDQSIWDGALSADAIATQYAKRSALLARITPVAKPVAQSTLGQVIDWKKLGVEEIVFVERHPGRDKQGHYYANFGYSCTEPGYWLHGADGGRLCRLNPVTRELNVILEDRGGSIRDPQVHYDARKILFSYRKGGTHHYNLYEINADGSELRQITDGPWDDVEPTYLPDGGIIFSSTRCKRYILCWVAPTAVLHRCDADGRNIRMLSSNTVTENTPSVLPDGRILYTRWEYVNRDPVVFHHLWTMNPDGSNQKVYFGNMHRGGVFIDAKPIPGTDQVVLINSPGHGRNEHEGHLATVSDRNGPDDRSSMKNIANGYRDPYPLTQDMFLAAKGNQIQLVNAEGKSRVVYNGTMMLHEPSVLKTRQRERIRPSLLDLSTDTATLVVSDVYVGRNMEGVKRGTIKKLLVLEDLPKPANFHGGGSQPLGHGVTSTLKRHLGTVPVEADGSAHFEVPAMRSIYLALLDENNRSVKQMRSFVTLQPGEITSCIGCHEPRTQAPPAGGRPTLQALNRKPSRIEPFQNIPDVLDFPRDVQPILDKHCVKCHNPEERKGNVVLSGDRGPVFSHSYYELYFQWQIKDTRGSPADRSGRQLGNDAPYAAYSSASALMDKIDGSHHDVTISDHERTIIRLWIDVSAQYPGTAAAIGTGQIGGMWDSNRPIREMADGWPSALASVDAFNRRCVSCHEGNLPKYVTDKVRSLNFGDMLSWERPLSRYSRHRIYNLTNPEKSLAVMAPLAKEAGGYAEGEAVTVVVRENRKEAPGPVKHPVVFKNASDADYQAILAHINAAAERLDEIKRFDMPGFKPNKHYVREMKRYGILPGDFDLKTDEIDVYETDREYWASFWHRCGEKKAERKEF